MRPRPTEMPQRATATGLCLAAVALAGPFGCTAELGSTAPYVAFASPGEGEFVSGTVDIWLDARPLLELRELSLARDGSVMQTWTSFPASAVYALDTAQVADGPLRLTANGVFRHGTAVDERMLMVDNEPPHIQITSPAAASFIYIEDGPFLFSGTASDASGLVRGELRAGDQVIEVLDPATETFSVDLDPASFVSAGAGGMTELTLIAEYVDVAGKTGRAEARVTLRSRLQWAFPVNGNIETAPAPLRGDAVAVGTVSGRLYVIEADGTERCSFAAPGEQILSGPVALSAARSAVVWGTTSRLRASSTQDCQTLWTYPVDAQWLATPAVSEDDRIYAATFDGIMHAVSPTGAALWTADLSDQLITGSLEAQGRAAITANGVVVQGGVLSGSTRDGAVVGLDATSGAWQWTLDSPAVRSGITATPFGVFFGTSDGRLYSLANDGMRRWSAEPLVGDGVDARCRPGLLDSGTVVTCDIGGIVAGFDAGSGGRVFSTDLAEVSMGTTGITDGGVTVGPDGRVYVGDVLGLVYALDRMGRALWTFQTQMEVVAPPAFGEQLLFVGSADQRLYALHILSEPPAGP